MNEKNLPHEQLTDKNNGLASAQEVVYQEEFKKADKVGEKEDENRDNNKKG